MYLTRRGFSMSEPYDVRHSLNRWFNGRLFDLPDLFRAEPRGFPALNIREDDQAWHVEAETPGFKMEDLELSVIGAELTIKGRCACACDEGASYRRRERRQDEFSRTVTLPAEIEADKVAATLKDGVLSITLPKAQVALARKIEVKAV